MYKMLDFVLNNEVTYLLVQLWPMGIELPALIETYKSSLNMIRIFDTKKM